MLWYGEEGWDGEEGGAFSRGGVQLVFATLWNLETGKEILRWEINTFRGQGAAFSANGKQIALMPHVDINQPRKILNIDPASGKTLRTVD